MENSPCKQVNKEQSWALLHHCDRGVVQWHPPVVVRTLRLGLPAHSICSSVGRLCFSRMFSSHLRDQILLLLLPVLRVAREVRARVDGRISSQMLSVTGVALLQHDKQLLLTTREGVGQSQTWQGTAGEDSIF